MARIHRADALAAVGRCNAEGAIGHLLAAQVFDPDANTSVLHEALSLAAPKANHQDRAEAIRRRAIVFLGRPDGASLRALIDILAEAGEHAAVAALDPPAPDLFAAPADLASFALVRATSARIAAGERQDAAEAARIDCLPLLDRLIEAHPLDRRLLTLRADWNATLQRYRDMIRDLLALERLGDRSDFVVHNLILMLRDKDRPEIARRLDGLVESIDANDVADLTSWFMVLLGMGAHDHALRLAQRLTPLMPSFAAVAPLHAMAKDLDHRPEAVLGIAPSGRRLIYASLTCWGAPYIEMMNRVSLPSLLAAGNLPALCADNDLVIEIMTDAAGVATIADLPLISRLAAFCQIKIFALPPEIHAPGGGIPYVIFGYAGHGATLRAQRDGADLILLQPDLLYGDQCFSFVAEIAPAERRAFFADGLNAAATPMLAAVERFRGTDGALAVPGPALSRLAGPHLMPRTFDNFFTTADREASEYPSRVVFRRDFGLSMHSFTKSPIYISHAAFANIANPSCGTPDAFFSQQILEQIERHELIEPDRADRFIVVEVSDSLGFTRGKVKKSLADSILHTFRFDMFSDRLLWLFEKPVAYETTGLRFGEIVDEAAQRAWLVKMDRLFRTHPVFTDLLTERRRLAKEER